MPQSNSFIAGIELAIPLVLQAQRLKAADVQHQDRMEIETSKLKLLEDEATEKLAGQKLQEDLFRTWGEIEEGQYSGVRSGKSDVPLTAEARRVIPEQTVPQLASYGFDPGMVEDIQTLQDPDEGLKKPTTLEAVIAQGVSSPEEALRLKLKMKGREKIGKTRKVQKGAETVTEEYTDEGWQEIGRGPKFKPTLSKETLKKSRHTIKTVLDMLTKINESGEIPTESQMIAFEEMTKDMPVEVRAKITREARKEKLFGIDVLWPDIEEEGELVLTRKPQNYGASDQPEGTVARNPTTGARIITQNGEWVLQE